MKVASLFRPAACVFLTLVCLAMLTPNAVAFFFPPVTVPPQTTPEPPIPVTPHVPPPPGQHHSPPPVDHAPEPATLISGAVGAGLLGLYSLRRRARKS
jgi:hypothetical protein